LPADISLKGLKLVVDCAHGATYHVAQDVFRELGATVHALGVEPDGCNINRDCGSTAPAAVQQAVLALGADLGIAFDGDGDRVVFVDRTGATVDGDQILYVIAAHRRRHGGGCTGVVGTLMSNYGLELALTRIGVPFLRTAVGDRYVIEALREREWALGGESSGHIVCRDLTTTGDGVVAALQVLRAVIESGLPLDALCVDMAKLPQTMINVAIRGSTVFRPGPDVLAAVSAAERKLAGRGRVLLRPSGTEPVIRVMVEGEDFDLVQCLAEEVATAVAGADC